MTFNWTTARYLRESNYGRLGLAEEPQTEFNPINGFFLKGHKTWNKGKTWNEMGIDGRTQRRMRNNLAKGRVLGHTKEAIEKRISKMRIPIIATNVETGKQTFFTCCARFAEKYGCAERNVRRALHKGYTCVGHKITRFND